MNSQKGKSHDAVAVIKKDFLGSYSNICDMVTTLLWNDTQLTIM